MNEHAWSITSEMLASSASTVCRLKIENLKFYNTFGPGISYRVVFQSQLQKGKTFQCPMRNLGVGICFWYGILSIFKKPKHRLNIHDKNLMSELTCTYSMSDFEGLVYFSPSHYCDKIPAKSILKIEFILVHTFESTVHNDWEGMTIGHIAFESGRRRKQHWCSACFILLCFYTFLVPSP